MPPQILPLTFGQDVLDAGSFAQLSCIVAKGDEPLKISWAFHGHELSEGLGIITSPLGTRGSSLMIPSVGDAHRGNYTCQVVNTAGKRQKTVELCVNGMGKTVHNVMGRLSAAAAVCFAGKLSQLLFTYGMGRARYRPGYNNIYTQL